MNIRAKRESPLTKAAAVAAAKSRFWKIERSSIGARPRCSISTNSGSSDRRDDQRADHQRSSQPEMPPREIP